MIRESSEAWITNNYIQYVKIDCGLIDSRKQVSPMFCVIVVHLFSMVSFFDSTCPIRSGVGAIDNPDHSGQVFEKYDISKVSEKISRTAFRYRAVSVKPNHSCIEIKNREFILSKFRFYETIRNFPAHLFHMFSKP